MLIQDILQVIVEFGVNMLTFNENEDWYVFDYGYPDFYNVDVSSEGSLDIQKFYRMLESNPSFYTLKQPDIRPPYHKLPPFDKSKIEQIEKPPLRGVRLNPIKVNLAVEYNTPSRQLIRRDMMPSMRRVTHTGLFEPNAKLPDGKHVEFYLKYIRKDILLDNIRCERKIHQVVNLVYFDNKNTIKDNINLYQNRVFEFVDRLKTNRNITKPEMRYRINQLVNIRLRLIDSINSDIDLNRVRYNIYYRDILTETKKYLSYRTDNVPKFSNHHEYNRALLDVSIQTLDNISSSAVCGIYPKK